MPTPEEAIAAVNRTYREFRRYTGDGLPGEPVNAPLPIGDPQSGVNSAKKSEIRATHIAALVAAGLSAEEAEAAADRAEAAADAAEAALSSISTTSFANLSAAVAYSPAVGPTYLRIEGYIAAGDGGGALYKKVASEPAHAGKFSITLADAVTIVWYELAETEIVVEMLGASSSASAAENFTAIDAARSLANSGGLPLVFGPGPYDFSATITFTGNDLIFWNNTVLMKQFDGEGVVFAGGPAVIYTHGRMLVQKGAGGSGPAGSGEDPANTIAGTAAGDHGIVLKNRMINFGELIAWYHHGDGIHISATANMNSSRFGYLRAQFNGSHGIGSSGTQDDVSLITMVARTYGNWKSGLHLADEFKARGWMECFVTAESNARDATSPSIYLGNAYADSNFKLYAENQATGTTDILIGVTSQYINIQDMRVNSFVNNSAKPWSINLQQKTNLLGNTPRAGFVRAGSVTDGTSRYIDFPIYGSGETLIMTIRIYGNGRMDFIPKAGANAAFRFLETGDFELLGTGKAIYRRSADGTRYRERIANGGTVEVTAVP